MAKNQTSEFSSAFDDLLEQSRRGWETLIPRVVREFSPSPAGESAQPAQPVRLGIPSASIPDVLVSSGEHASARSVWDPAKSEAAMALFKRFGSGWRIEVAEKRREGDEFVVRVTLTVPDKGIAIGRLGRGRIPAGGTGAVVQGSAGGVSFSIAPKPGAADGSPRPSEDRGYRRAIENGLARCVESL
jgi:hypothetical protein